MSFHIIMLEPIILKLEIKGSILCMIFVIFFLALHLGFQKTHIAIRGYYYWSSTKGGIQEYVE